MKRSGQRENRTSIDLLEEAVHLLRTAPSSLLACYSVGALPFILGLLYFVAEMSRSPFAYRHLVDYALAMGLLFVWMKFWQSIFAQRLLAHLTGVPFVLTWRTGSRIFLTQAALQPSGLFLVALALLPVAPFPWVFGFYQNLTVQADGTSTGLKQALRNALRQARLWPRQNHIIVLMLAAFGLFVWVNWATVCFTLPQLVKMLLGIESVFTRGGLGILNSTSLIAIAGLTYLCVDPLIKAVYTLRCFYGNSLASGDDLKAELRQFAVTASSSAAAIFLLLALAQTCAAASFHESDAVTQPQPGYSSGQLDQAIREVAQQRKYVWRMPRDASPEPEEQQPGLIRRFLERAAGLIGSAFKAVGKAVLRCLEAVGKAIGWLLRKIFGGRQMAMPGGAGSGWKVLLQLLLYALALGVLVCLGVLLYRVWRRRHQPARAVASEAITPTPDLADENVGAEQLPEDGWSRLGRELLAKGELRLALRAFYLASLAHLAARNLVQLAKFKSNRDYERELRRRAHALPEVVTVFGQNVAAFEPVWYGRHQVDAQLVDRLAANLDRIRGVEATA